MKTKLAGYYDYTVVLTYCGMLFAFYGILQALNQNYWGSVFCLMLAGVCDMFDGIVAATKTRGDSEKRFGIQIDSMSDLISFGVFPGIFIYIISDKNALTGLTASMYVLCALIRLAYFNVLEEERQRQDTGKRKSYMGIPVTSVAVLLPIVYLAYDCRVCKSAVCFPVLLGFMGAGFLAPVEIKKPGLFGKIGIIILGFLEAFGMVFFMGWDAL